MQLLLAITLLSCAQFGALIILPALPDIAQEFSISGHYAQQVVLLYFVGFGISQLLFGPWCDSAGSRQVFLIGQTIFILGSIIAVMADSPEMLAWARLIQGLGAGSPFIINRTLLNETMGGEKLKKALASLGLAASITPVLASFFGGWITESTSWQFVFLVVSGYALLVFCIGFRLIDKASTPSSPISFSAISKEYTKLLCDSRFLTIALFKWVPTLLFLSSQTLLPFEFQQKLSINAQQFGVYMMIPAGGLIAGATLAKWLQNYLSHKTMLVLFLPLLLAAGLGFTTLTFSLISSLLLYSAFMMSAGVYYTCSLQMIITPFPKKVGTVNALTGAIDMLVFSALAALVNKVWIVNSQALGKLYLLATVILFISWLLIHARSKNDASCNAGSSLKPMENE